MKSNLFTAFGLVTLFLGVRLDVVTEYNGFCAVCINEGY